jgi:hypothetical protein
MRIEYCPTGDMWGDFFTKPLQGSPFKRQRAKIMNLPYDVPLPITSAGSKECVEINSWKDVVRGTDKKIVSQRSNGHLPITMKKVSGTNETKGRREKTLLTVV